MLASGHPQRSPDQRGPALDTPIDLEPMPDENCGGDDSDPPLTTDASGGELRAGTAGDELTAAVGATHALRRGERRMHARSFR
jgi:hypothetical protein